jgi:hypothetical protein
MKANMRVVIERQDIIEMLNRKGFVVDMPTMSITTDGDEGVVEVTELNVTWTPQESR